MDRRAFLRTGASTLLALPFGTFLLHCGDDDDETTTITPTVPDPSPPDSPPQIEGPNIIYTSSETNFHSHSFPIPIIALSAPPDQGISGNTTTAQAHSHTVVIARADLERANAGEAVKIPTSEDLGHIHVFTLVRV